MHVLFSKSSHCLSYLLEYVSALKILRRVKLQNISKQAYNPRFPKFKYHTKWSYTSFGIR